MTGKASKVDSGAMDATSEVLAQLRERVAQYRGRPIGEENTKAVLIAPLLRALGWDTENLDEVRLEYRRRPADKPVDYALFMLGAPRLFVEAKGLGENLDDRKWASQIISYATVAGVGWAVLTDGDEYRLYNAHAPVPVEEKLFRRVKISDESTRPEQTLNALSKAHIAAMEDVWRAEYANRQVEAATRALFAPTPDAGLIRLIRKRVTLPTPEIRSVLARMQLTFETREPAIESAPPRVGTRGRRSAVPRTRRVSRSDVSLKDVLAAGLVIPPVELTKVYLGRTLAARIEVDGRVRFQGATYESLSAAAGMARASVIGAPAGQGYPPTNGWSFWSYRDAAGNLVPVASLRVALSERQTLPSNVRPIQASQRRTRP